MNHAQWQHPSKGSIKLKRLKAEWNEDDRFRLVTFVTLSGMRRSAREGTTRSLIQGCS